jgi:ferrous iron transport protein B
VANLVKLGVDMENFDYVVALAGNPNTGKSTVFNSLTGLRQHTGNWPGKTVARGGARRGRFLFRRQPLQAGGPSRYLLAAIGQSR